MSERGDDFLTVAAIGLLAYLIADLAHHLVGHGGACLLAHGEILRLSSIVLDCSAASPGIDLAGPVANFVVGFCAFWVAGSHVRGTLKILAALTAAFNLFWFAGQMLVSVATRTDDWAWAMSELQLGSAARFLLVGTGLAVYLGVIRTLAAVLADFASSRERLAGICRSAWSAAALVASVSALFDADPMSALWKHALPQGLLSPLGLLLVPGRAVPCGTIQSSVPRSWTWIVAGVLGASISLGLLGAGVSLRGL